MRFALSLLGQEVFAVSLSKDDVTTEEIAEVIAQAVSGKDEGEAKDLTGGHFERDPNPIDPIGDRYPEWQEDKFGFGE